MFDNLKKSVEKLNKINPKSLLTGFVQSQRVHSKDYHELLNVYMMKKITFCLYKNLIFCFVYYFV